MTNEPFAFGAILADAVANAIKGVLVESSLVAPDDFTFSQAFTVEGRIFGVRVVSGHAESFVKGTLADADS